MSIAWSAVPSVTRDIIGVQVFFYVLCVLTARYSVDKDLDLSLKLVAFLIISVIVFYALLYPGSAISPQGFKALYAHKNGLGLVMAICLLMILCSHRPGWLDVGFAAIALLFLLLSRSKTSIYLFALIYALFLASALFRKWLVHVSGFTRELLTLGGKGLLGMAYGAIAALLVFREAVTGYLAAALPHDFLTGRGEIWALVLQRSDLNLLQGIGPGAFWGAGRLSEIAQTSLYTQHPFWIERLGSADGGYIDLVGALGFIGVTLLLLSIVSNIRRLQQRTGLPAAGVAMALISLFIFHNLTETTIYHSTNFLWFMYLYFSYYLIFMRAKTAHPCSA